jgi:hypothetical protein
MISTNCLKLLIASALGLTSMAAYANARVKGSDQTVTVDCKGGAAVVEGSSNNVRFTGVCSSLSITGADNEVSVALSSGAKVNVMGSSNDVNWSSKGKVKPVVKVMGADNDIVRVR